MVDIRSPRQTFYRQQSLRTSFQQEVEGKLVGVDVLYDVNPSPQDKREIEKMHQVVGEFARNGNNYRSLAFAMHNNTDNQSLKVGRPRSAYFTYDPYENTVTVEWGEINSKGDAKLHHYLNRVIDYHTRHQKGMVVRSGHVARFEDTPFWYALLDPLVGPGSPVVVPDSDKLHPMVRILGNNRRIVISTDGYVCVPQTK